MADHEIRVGHHVTIGHGQLRWEVVDLYVEKGESMALLSHVETGVEGRARVDRLRQVSR